MLVLQPQRTDRPEDLDAARDACHEDKEEVHGIGWTVGKYEDEGTCAVVGDSERRPTGPSFVKEIQAAIRAKPASFLSGVLYRRVTHGRVESQAEGDQEGTTRQGRGVCEAVETSSAQRQGQSVRQSREQ